MFKDKVKKFLAPKENQPNKKKLENLVVFLIILIITIIVINVIWNDNETNTDKGNTVDSNKRLATTEENINTQEENLGDELENKLKNILSKIDGVGNVEVLITYSETSSVQPVYNEESTEENTEETDSAGGTRKITQTDTRKEVVYEEQDGTQTLVIQSTTSPKIEGAIITADGANNSTVKTNIIQAVEAATGLATHKIQVFEMRD